MSGQVGRLMIQFVKGDQQTTIYDDGTIIKETIPVQICDSCNLPKPYESGIFGRYADGEMYLFICKQCNE